MITITNINNMLTGLTLLPRVWASSGKPVESMTVRCCWFPAHMIDKNNVLIEIFYTTFYWT